MTTLLSSCSYAGEKVPEKYVFPPEKRPGNAVKGNIPIIDLQDHENNNKINHFMEVAQELGLFQVINHGVSGDLMDEAMQMFEEFFKLPYEEKMKINNNEEDTNGVCRIFTNTLNKNYPKHETPFWRDGLRHQIENPLEKCIKFWPQKPEKYREIVGPYVIAVQNLGWRILDLIAHGLELERGFFKNRLGEANYFTVNHYPPCPDPSLTLGVGEQIDYSFVTILQQRRDIRGLQVKLKDGQWMEVETLPHAFVVIIGNHLQIVSDGKLRNGIHRALKNESVARTSAALFMKPSPDSIVEPARRLIVQALPVISQEPNEDTEDDVVED